MVRFLKELVPWNVALGQSEALANNLFMLRVNKIFTNCNIERGIKDMTWCVKELHILLPSRDRK